MKVILMVLILATFLIAQVSTVRTIPQWHEGEYIFGTQNAAGQVTAGMLGANADGADTSSSFSAKSWTGAAGLFMLSDTTGASVAAANQSDSCLTIILQLKDKDLGWGGLYNESTANYTKLDTVARSLVNVGGTNMYYMILADETAWAAADSARFIFQIGIGDSLYLKARSGGQ